MKNNEKIVPNILVGIMISGLLILITTCFYLLYRIIPVYDNYKLCFDFWNYQSESTCIDISGNSESRMILLVILGGIMGSFIHAATSFTTYLGVGKLRFNWLWWYLLRPFIGATLALIIYFLIRGGLFSPDSGSENVNVYGILALAGLAGMFSKKTSDWLKEVFDNVFKTRKSPEDKVQSIKDDDLTVKDQMIKRSDIVDFIIEKGKSVEDIKLSELINLFELEKKNRLLIMDYQEYPKYIIHKSEIDAFILQKSNSDNASVKQIIDKLYLNNFLGNNPEESKYSYKQAFTCIDENSTFDQAIEAMSQLKHGQDLIVTKNGSPNEEVIGWITNVILSNNN